MSHHHPHGPGCACCTLPLLAQLHDELSERPDWQDEAKRLIRQQEKHLLPPSPPQTLIIYGGPIHTLASSGRQTVDAIGIAKGRIAATGSCEEVRQAMAAAGHKKPEEMSLEGATLLPGFVDPHMHILPSALFSSWQYVGAFSGQTLTPDYGIAGVENTVRAALADPKKQQKAKDGTAWVLGFGLDPSLMRVWTEPDLDWFAQFGDSLPIFLMNASGHIGYANAPALAKAGISPECKGVLVEEQVLQMMPALPSPSPAALLSSISQVLHGAAKMGNTTLFDAGLGSGKGLFEVLLLDLVAQTALNPVRIAAALFSNETRQMDEWTRLFRPDLDGMEDKRFSIKALKLVSDGSNQGLTGFQTEAYKCYPEHQVPNVPATGLFNFRPPSAFAPHLRQAVEHGWPAMVHANGDRAIDEVLQAYEHALNHPLAPLRPDCAGTRLRHRIEHASLLTDEHISQMAQLQLSPSFLIGHVGYWGRAFQQTILGEARAKLLDRCLSAKRAGLRISLHSDHFVTPLGGLRMMEQAIFRVMEAAPEQAGGKPALNPAERLDRLSALRAVTLDAAWQCHMDHIVGSLEPGKLADLVVLEQDPLDPAVSNLRDIAVLQTWRSGAPVYLHAKLGCATESAPPA